MRYTSPCDIDVKLHTRDQEVVLGSRMTERLALELDDLLAARLKQAAAKEEMTAEAFAADAVRRAVISAEEWVEDEAAYAEYERTGESIPLEAAEKWVRSWGTADELPPPQPCKSSS
jgi:predicted transcriptional regulator